MRLKLGRAGRREVARDDTIEVVEESVSPAVRHEAGPGVRVIITRSDDLGEIVTGSVDVVFATPPFSFDIAIMYAMLHL